MHYLAKHLEDESPALIAFPGELPHVGDAKRISLKQLVTYSRNYTAEVTMLQGQVKASENSKDSGDRFYTVMKPFAKEASVVAEELSRDIQSLESSFSELVASYGEDSRKLGTEEFFSIIG